MRDEHEHDIDNELGSQSREEAADDAMFNKVLLLAANIGPQSAAPSSPARVEAQARDARRLVSESEAANQPARPASIPIVLCGIYRLRINMSIVVKGQLVSASRRDDVGSGTFVVSMFGREWSTRVKLDELLPDDDSTKG